MACYIRKNKQIHFENILLTVSLRAIIISGRDILRKSYVPCIENRKKNSINVL